jgi:hypothetical protein
LPAISPSKKAVSAPAAVPPLAVTKAPFHVAASSVSNVMS